MQSHYFLCCVTSDELTKDGVLMPDCWENGWAEKSREACCNTDAFEHMDVRAMSLTKGSTESPCANADNQTLKYLEDAGERLFYLGEPYGDDEVEEQLIFHADETYEACPAALLLALAARVCRFKVLQSEMVNMAYRIYEFWNSLRWSQMLAWNVLDPLVRSSLHASAAYIQLVNALWTHPWRTCHSFETGIVDLLKNAAGLSLTTSKSTGMNLVTYPDIARTALVLSFLGTLVSKPTWLSSCEVARALAHLFNARRFWDLRRELAVSELRKAVEVEMKAVNHFPRIGDAIEVPGIWGVYDQLREGLTQQREWQSKPDQLSASVFPSLSPFSLWDPAMNATFSSSVNDGVIERLLTMLEVKGPGTFVEIGTQLGDQCNTRYLRARYNFYGLMIDDNYNNPEINLTTHRVTPDNVVELLQRYSTPLEFDVLSLDTDGHQWLLWMRLCMSNFRPKVVVVEYGEEMPYDQDLAIRYSPLPIHQLCLMNVARHPWLFGASLTSMRNLGQSLGYTLVHLAEVDLTFVRSDLLQEKNLQFPAQDDPAGLCALARYQAPHRQRCWKEWPKMSPSKELFTTASKAIAGDYRIDTQDWPMERMLTTFSMQKRKVVQYLSKYIKGLNADQVSSRLFSGEVELRDAELEVEPVKKLLAGTLPYTLEILAISCDRLNVQVPWSHLRSRPVQVKVGHLRMQVRVHSSSDRSWAESVAVSAAISKSEQKPQEKQDEEQKSFRLADVKVGVIDGFSISVASLHVLCAQAPQAASSSQPLFAFEFELAGLSLQPIPFGKVSSGNKAKRLRSGQWTSLKRRLEVEHVRLAAAQLTDKSTSKDALLEVKGCSLDLVEGRDIGRREDHRNPSARMAMFPRQIRGNLNVQELRSQIQTSEILGFIDLLEHVKQPTCPPSDLLRPEVHEEVKVAVTEFLARSKGRSFSIFRGVKKGPKAVLPKRTSDRELGKAGTTQISDMAAEMADVMATKAMKAGAVADAASAAAADKARRTAVAASAAALKASNALGGARRSGQAAAEKALGSLMRVGGLTTKTSKKDEVGRSLTKEEEELQAVLALSLKEFEDQQAKDAKVAGEERDDGSPDLKRLESDPIDQPLQEGEDPDLVSLLESSSSSDAQSVGSDLEDYILDVESIEMTSLAHDTSLAFLENPSQPPMALRMISLHAAITKIDVVLPVPGDTTGFSLELCNLNFSGDTYLHLFRSEMKCLQRLSVLKDLTIPEVSGHASSGSLTLCSIALRYCNDHLLDVQHLPKVTPWMLTLRISYQPVVPVIPIKQLRSDKMEVVIDGCLHGLRLYPEMPALKAWETSSLALQTILDAIRPNKDETPLPEKPSKSEMVSDGVSWCTVNFHLWNTILDLKKLIPAPLTTLQLVLPELHFKATDGLLGFSPPVPQWHVFPTPCATAEPDFYLYDMAGGVEPEADSKYAKSFEGTWEVLVTERKWFPSTIRKQVQRLLLPATEMLEFSRSKLKVMESAQRLEDLAEREHVESCCTIEKEAAELLPKVKERMDSKETLDAELEVLRVELREVDQKRREEELELKSLEKDLGTEVAQFRHEKLLREQKLQRQLYEEEMITQALTRLVTEQAEIIAQLQSGE
eukprot:symbB.v1.2.003019.t1/scaffold113.1/size324549/17